MKTFKEFVEEKELFELFSQVTPRQKSVENRYNKPYEPAYQHTSSNLNQKIKDKLARDKEIRLQQHKANRGQKKRKIS